MCTMPSVDEPKKYTSESGRIAGRDLENWAQAEQEIRREMYKYGSAAIVVKVNGVRIRRRVSRANI